MVLDFSHWAWIKALRLWFGMGFGQKGWDFGRLDGRMYRLTRVLQDIDAMTSLPKKSKMWPTNRLIKQLTERIRRCKVAYSTQLEIIANSFWTMCFGIFSFWIWIYSESFSDQDILWQICVSASDFFCDLSCSRPYRVSIFISLLLPGSTWTAMGWAKIDTCHYSLSSCGVNMMHCWRGLSSKRSRSCCWTKALQENMLLMHLHLILILPHSRDLFQRWTFPPGVLFMFL